MRIVNSLNKVTNKIFSKLFIANLITVTILTIFFLWLFEVLLTFNILISLFFVFIVTLLINFIISKNIANPLEGMVYTAERFSKEDFSNKIKPSKIYEINSLAKSLNLMAEKLNERIRAITIQKNENDAILISMSEGVIATNRLSEIIKVNDYLVKLFDLKDNIIGFDVRTIIRNQQFLDFYNRYY